MVEEVGEGSNEALNSILCFSLAAEAQAFRRQRVDLTNCGSSSQNAEVEEEQGGVGGNNEMVREEKAF